MEGFKGVVYFHSAGGVSGERFAVQVLSRTAIVLLREFSSAQPKPSSWFVEGSVCACNRTGRNILDMADKWVNTRRVEETIHENRVDKEMPLGIWGGMGVCQA